MESPINRAFFCFFGNFLAGLLEDTGTDDEEISFFGVFLVLAGAVPGCATLGCSGLSLEFIDCLSIKALAS